MMNPVGAAGGVQGFHDLRFELVREAFAKLFSEQGETGAALAVMYKGEMVLDLWGGTMDKEQTQPWHHDTLVNVFSVGKGVAALIMLQLVDLGLLELDKPLVHWWPEFGQNGKQDITLRQVLTHTAGLVYFPHAIPDDDLFNIGVMVRHVEQLAPVWKPGSQLGYSPIIFGWIVGELCRRVSGLTMGEYVQQKLFPVVDDEGFYFGVPGNQLKNIARVERGDFPPEPASEKFNTALMKQPDSLTAKAFTNPLAIMAGVNKKEWQQTELPSANGHGTARFLAKLFGRLSSNDGSLLSKNMLKQAITGQISGNDKILLCKLRFGLGYMLSQPAECLAGFGSSISFGHTGAGGGLAFSDPVQQLGFAYVTRKMANNVLVDPRADKLVQIVSRFCNAVSND